MKCGSWIYLEECLVQTHDLGLELLGSRLLRQRGGLHSCIEDCQLRVYIAILHTTR